MVHEMLRWAKPGKLGRGFRVGLFGQVRSVDVVSEESLV